MSVIKNLSQFVMEVIKPDDEPSQTPERFGEMITPNMRALRLSMTVADNLLAMGVPVSDVVGMSLDITDRYCKRKVAIEISSTLLMFSQDRGNDVEPLTLIRSSSPRAVNTTLIQSLSELAQDIYEGKLYLDEAEKQLEDILDNPKTQPLWLITAGNAAISAGVSALLSASWLIVGITFVIGAFVSYLLALLMRKKVPAFFVQAIAAGVTTMIAASLIWLGNHGVDALARVNPNLIIIGGIVMLLSGLAIVGAVEDAINEFYMTANARLLKVIMLTLGIVAGVIGGLYIAKQMGVSMTVSAHTPVIGVLGWQYLGAVMIAGGYALSVHGRMRGIALSALVGVGSWFVFALASGYFSRVVASFAAATAVGAVATLLSRWLRTPSSIMVTAGIIPLVPGLPIYNGLMVLVVGMAESSAHLGSGGAILMNAILIALAIAAGATFGILVTQPVRRTLVRAHNALPRRKLH